MPLTILDEFNIKYLQVIDEAGNADASLASGLPDALYKKFFEAIILARAFNQRAVNLQREGRLGTYPSILGQEASQIGSALAFEPSDWLVTSFRETGVYITQGYPLPLLLRYWMGDERGMRCPDGLHIYPMAVPVGSQIPHAVGVGMAMRYRGDKKTVGVYFGDGGSSRGDFHEGLNLAGVSKAPVVFLCQNNQWAISVPRSRQTAAKSIAQRAISYGMEGIQVDGNDIAAVYKAATDAVARAKAGDGPTLIECYTYRLDNHTTSDDASRYRVNDEVEQWRKREPLIRLRIFLEKKGLWTQAYEDEVTQKALAQVDEAVVAAEAMAFPETADIIRYTNKELSPRQLMELKEHGGFKTP